MVESATARKRRLKALRRKHKLGEFSKKAKSKTRKTRTRSRRVKTVRPKTVSRRSRTMPKKKRRSTRKTFGGGLQKPLVAGVTYAFVQPIASQILSRFNIGIQDELAQILLAVVAKSMLKNTVVNNWANAAIIVNTASLVGGFSGNLFNTNRTVNSTPTMNVVG